ncbi:MAG: nuclear transport factor 2 family protein [Alphaproteobacteria bacterium HGW-Alphaproteobacteria-12]|nr:MAG: nuclear transport factor 2 family protein [Alphaproteobacteria bacterium HGW-Alphaproteobacteria-12]
MSDEARAFLDRWYAYVENHDPALLDALVAEGAEISSPAFFKPKASKEYVLAILTAVTAGFEDFSYTKEWVDGQEIILEFTARFGDKQLKGIDRITVNDKGQITHIEVLIRPLNGLIALAEYMKAQFENAA